MLIRNRKIEFIKNLLLILLVVNFSSSAFFIHSMKEDECCCHVKKEEVKQMTCCEIQETKTSVVECNYPQFENVKNIVNCGCIHNYNTSKQTIQLVKTNDIPKVKLIAELSNEWNLQTLTRKTSNTLFIEYKESPPIYLIDSSFLI